MNFDWRSLQVNYFSEPDIYSDLSWSCLGGWQLDWWLSVYESSRVYQYQGPPGTPGTSCYRGSNSGFFWSFNLLQIQKDRDIGRFTKQTERLRLRFTWSTRSRQPSSRWAMDVGVDGHRIIPWCTKNEDSRLSLLASTKLTLSHGHWTLFYEQLFWIKAWTQCDIGDLYTKGWALTACNKRVWCPRRSGSARKLHLQC
jgi:hypothetical protein